MALPSCRLGRSFGPQPTHSQLSTPWQGLTLTEQALDLDQRMARFRLGHDVMRALALDAKSCMIGRTYGLCPAAEAARRRGRLAKALISGNGIFFTIGLASPLPVQICFERPAGQNQGGRNDHIPCRPS